jgi:hypothetical protein
VTRWQIIQGLYQHFTIVAPESQEFLDKTLAPNLTLDIVKLDDWLKSRDKTYDEDKESMEEYVAREYGQKAVIFVRDAIKG